VKKIKLDVESLMVMTFATEAPQPVAAPAAFASEEITDCTCQPYFCIRWPSNNC
jgi:hypothetical protein